MTSIMTLNYLFFIGIIIPTVITISLFVVFIVCWYRIKVRRDIMRKRHDPHGTLEKKYGTRVLQPVPPPLPKWNTMLELKYTHNNNLDNNGYEKSPDLQDPHSREMYHTFHDSGMTDLSEIHYKLEPDRPKSQASTDSEDSGFRSSRSAQYIHSASSSNATQETPLFKPISVNQEEPSHRVSLPPTERKQKPPCRHKRHSSSSPSRHRQKCEPKRLNNTNINHLPMWTTAGPPRELTITTAMVHRPHMEELALIKCNSMTQSVV